jgi:hypothetical protein
VVVLRGFTPILEPSTWIMTRIIVLLVHARNLNQRPEVVLTGYKLKIQHSNHASIETGSGGGAHSGAAAGVGGGVPHVGMGDGAGQGKVLIARVANEVYPMDIDTL